MDIPTTWQQLEEQAAGDELQLSRAFGRVTVLTCDRMPSPLLTITAGDITDEDSDVVMRRTLAAGLRALKDLPR